MGYALVFKLNKDTRHYAVVMSVISRSPVFNDMCGRAFDYPF